MKRRDYDIIVGPNHCGGCDAEVGAVALFRVVGARLCARCLNDIVNQVRLVDSLVRGEAPDELMGK